MINNSPTALEMVVLRAIGKLLPSYDRAALEQQIEGIMVSSRENTGAGFYTDFVLQSKTMNRIHVNPINCGVRAKIDKIDDALGFVLWLKDGYVACLEGYALALDSTVNIDFDALNDFEINPSPKVSRL